MHPIDQSQDSSGSFLQRGGPSVRLERGPWDPGILLSWLLRMFRVGTLWRPQMTCGLALCHWPHHQASLLLVLLHVSPRAPVAFLRVWDISRKGDEPRIASLAKQTHTTSEK